MSEFQFGIYEHYKGGRYTAIMLVTHHQTRRPMVVYVSHEKHSVNCRPLRGWRWDGTRVLDDGPVIDEDGFLDDVRMRQPTGGVVTVPRFRYVGPARE